MVPNNDNEISISDAETQPGSEHSPSDNEKDNDEVHENTQTNSKEPENDVEIEPAVDLDNPEPKNKRYDKRLAPLLYDFFLRANEKFEWSREEFLEKYQNYRNNVKIIKIRKIKDNYIGIFKILDKAIYI